MEVRKEVINDQLVVIHIEGSLLADNEGKQLLDLCEQVIQEGKKQLILDLSGMKHVNSSGLGVFIRMLTRTRTLGGDVVLTGVNEGVSNLFTITKLHTIFRFAPTVAAAKELF